MFPHLPIIVRDEMVSVSYEAALERSAWFEASGGVGQGLHPLHPCDVFSFERIGKPPIRSKETTIEIALGTSQNTMNCGLQESQILHIFWHYLAAFRIVC